MSVVAVAMAEIVREGTWALRALGYPYGTAERAASLLAWTEAVHGHGLTMLRLGEVAIAAGAARSQPRWNRDSQGRRCAEAHGKCLFECGPPALDLATADARLGARLDDPGFAIGQLTARRLTAGGLADLELADGVLADGKLAHGDLAEGDLADGEPADRALAAGELAQGALVGGLGRAVLRGAIGTRLAGALGAMAARRGLATVLVHAPGAAEIAPVPPAGWICALPTSLGPAFLANSLDQPLPAMLPTPLQVAAEDISEARAAGDAGFFSIAVSPCAPMKQPPGATDWPRRLTLAYRTGIDADPADYETLYELEMRTWAPTSERSRNQAGFGRF